MKVKHLIRKYCCQSNGFEIEDIESPFILLTVENFKVQGDYLLKDYLHSGRSGDTETCVIQKAGREK